jgi:hypothetical protein
MRCDLGAGVFYRGGGLLDRHCTHEISAALGDAYIQIFASDIDDKAIDKARVGFIRNIVAHVRG